MKSNFLLALLFTVGIPYALFAQKHLPLSDESTFNITDMVLIYQGGTHRPEWTRHDLRPYLFRQDEGGNPEWLFDGFLFIEFKDNKGYEYAQGYKQKPAGREQWQWLLDRNFEEDKAIDALNNLLDSLNDHGNRPVRKRKVILTLPEPIKDHQGWGEIQGKTLDFSLASDRFAACTWYIDHALSYWEHSEFKHLELAGFYWVAEQSSASMDLLPEISSFIHEKGKKFFWIPYWKASGAGDWKQSGFDCAYQQPNHFFNTNTPDSRLDEACEYAADHGMGMEFEFDNRVNKPEFRQRFYSYIDAYKKHGIWDNVAIAYYEGGTGILNCSRSNNPEIRKVYDDLADIIIMRQLKVD